MVCFGTAGHQWACSNKTYELPPRNPSCLPPKLMCFHFVPFMLYERLQFYGWHINTKCTVLSHNGKFSPFLQDTVFQRPWRKSTGNNLQWLESLGSSGHLCCVDELNNDCGQKGKNRSFKEGNTQGTFRVILTDGTMDKSKVQCWRKVMMGSFFVTLYWPDFICFDHKT